MATYNVDITRKAVKSFGGQFSEHLVNAHRAFDPSAPASAVKVFTNQLGYGGHKYLYVGSGGRATDYRYIRIVIDVIAGSRAAVEKDSLIRHVLRCCMDYEGKDASECEFDLRINEIDPRNIMNVGGVTGRR